MSAQTADQASIDTAILLRWQTSIESLLRSMSKAAKIEAAGSADVPQFLLALARHAPAIDPAERNAAERLAQAAAFKRDLVERAGGALTTDGVRGLLGYKSTQAVHKAVAARRLFCVDDNGTRLFPAFQFDGASIRPAMAAVLAAAPQASGWALLQFLVEGDEGLGADRPLALLDGGPQAVERLARFVRTLDD